VATTIPQVQSLASETVAMDVDMDNELTSGSDSDDNSVESQYPEDPLRFSTPPPTTVLTAKSPDLTEKPAYTEENNSVPALRFVPIPIQPIQPIPVHSTAEPRLAPNIVTNLTSPTVQPVPVDSSRPGRLAPISIRPKPVASLPGHLAPITLAMPPIILPAPEDCTSTAPLFLSIQNENVGINNTNICNQNLSFQLIANLPTSSTSTAGSSNPNPENLADQLTDKKPERETLLEEEMRNLRKELSVSKKRIQYLTQKISLKNEISPAMLRTKLKEIFGGEENPLTLLILTQMKRYSYYKPGTSPYRSEEKDLIWKIYDSVGRKGYT